MLHCNYCGAFGSYPAADDVRPAIGALDCLNRATRYRANVSYLEELHRRRSLVRHCWTTEDGLRASGLFTGQLTLCSATRRSGLIAQNVHCHLRAIETLHTYSQAAISSAMLGFTWKFRVSILSDTRACRGMPWKAGYAGYEACGLHRAASLALLLEAIEQLP